jgi:hypothetical protein
MEVGMRTLAIVLAVLMIASIAMAEKKPEVMPVPSGLRALDCTNAIPINCGDVVNGDNTGMPNNVSAYSCTGWSETGGEVVYQLVIPAGVCYEVTGALSGMTGDLDVWFLGSCDENDCLTYGDTGFTTGCLEPGTYYIVVDGYYGAASPFTLTLTCVECACPVPACCPFENTVYLVDFNESDGGFMPMACSGASTWEWGPLANSGVPAIACDDVPVTNILGTTIADNYPVNAGEIAAVGPFHISQYTTCLELCHFVNTEASYDGCNVKISTDGGATWTLITPSDGYPGSTNTSPFCIPSQGAFTGHIMTAFERDCFDISDFVGTDILVGFFFGSDSSVTYPGWYIKWLKIGSNNSSPVEEGSWGSLKAMYR